MPTQTLTQVRAARLELNTRILDLAGEPDLDDEREAEFGRLTSEAAALSRREAAMVAAGADEPPEVLAAGEPAKDDFGRLVAESSVADVLDQAIFDRRIGGATAELQDELSLPANSVPLELFAASSVTSAGDSQIQEATVRQVFPSAISTGLGVDRRSVGVGIANLPVVVSPTDGPTATSSVGTAATATTTTIEARQFAPSPLLLTATIGKEEIATFRGIEDQVAGVLRQAITSGLDYQALYAGTADGILNHGTAPAASTTVATYASFLAAVYAALDGRYASGLMDLHTLLGPATARLAAASYRGTTSDNETAWDALMSRTGGVMTSALVADPSSDDQAAVTFRGGPGMPGAAQRTWGGAEIIRDNLTLASSAQCVVTVILLQATKIIRADSYRRHSFHLD